MSENTQQQKQEKLAFGLNGVAPADAKAVWGARAIFYGGRCPQLDIVWDRQDATGEGPDRFRLQQALNDGAVDSAREKFRRLVLSGALHERDNENTTLFDDGRLIIVGNPRASYGYMYLAAWLIPGAE